MNRLLLLLVVATATCQAAPCTVCPDGQTMTLSDTVVNAYFSLDYLDPTANSTCSEVEERAISFQDDGPSCVFMRDMIVEVCGCAAVAPPTTSFPTVSPTLAIVPVEPTAAPMVAPELLNVSTNLSIRLAPLNTTMTAEDQMALAELCATFLSTQDDFSLSEVQCTIANQATTRRQLRQLQDEPALTIDVIVTALAPIEGSESFEENVVSSLNNDAFVSALNNASPFFQDVTTVSASVPAAPTSAPAPDDSSDTGLSSGAIVGICVAGAGLAVIIIVVAYRSKNSTSRGALLQQKNSKASDPDATDNSYTDHPPPNAFLASQQRLPPKEYTNATAVATVQALQSNSIIGRDEAVGEGSVIGGDHSTISSHVSTRIVQAPPGKLGIVISDTGNGPQVMEVKPYSSLRDSLFVGDVIVGINNNDTRTMTANQLLDCLRTNSKLRRTLTVISADVSR